jgi:plasmid maintenance system killer protein
MKCLRQAAPSDVKCLAGQHSIRINDQWRICFVWKGGDAHDVEIVDYH